METAEHFYTDDPGQGPPDVRTRIPSAEYFFLGNGLIQAAVQVCGSGEGTPAGLLLLDPDGFGPKREALTCHPETGLDGTMLRVRVGVRVHAPLPGCVTGEWCEVEGTPAVRVLWVSGEVQVEETFTCPDVEQRAILRTAHLRVQGGGARRLFLRLGDHGEEFPLTADPSGVARAHLVHEVHRVGGEAAARYSWLPVHTEASEALGTSAPGFWASLAQVRTSDPGLNHLFTAARNQLPVSVDRRGRMDGSIWQYNLEWVRDQSHVAEAFLRLGDRDKARVMLSRLLTFFVSQEGDTVDSGRRRPTEEVELDQNGTLLSALSVYLDWTGDQGFLEDHWDRIRALADFPFEDRFRHVPSGLLHNCREYWERHEAHGIRDGFELMSQFAVAMGLEAASHMAADLDRREDADRWARRAQALKKAMLDDPLFRLVADGHLIKRRSTDGAWQRTIALPEDSDLPDGVPLHGEGLHLLDPDTSTALPIAHGFISPEGELARGTLAHLETLWNQSWEGGGYGRYNATSEPDSPGAWPFASLFVARAYTESGDDEKVWRILRWLQETQGGRSGAWFENDGPRISPPYPQVGITPWTWAEIITLFVHHFLGFRPHSEGILIRPRLLAGLETMEASLRVRGRWVHLRIEATAPGQSPGGRVTPLDRVHGPTDESLEGTQVGGPLEGIPLEFHSGGFRIPYPDTDLRLDLSI